MTQTPTSRRALVTGASVAGPAAAYWLAEIGYDVTVVEQAPSLREGGQNIDVRATGREVLRRMGLEDAVRERHTGEVGTRFVDEDGQTVSEFGVDEREGRDGPTAELEILRGALARVLVEACPPSVRWRFGERVAAVTIEDGGAGGEAGVVVELDTGESTRYDLLVVAEGVGSHTRRLVFGDEPEERALGMYAAYATIDRLPTDDDWWQVLVARGSRQAALRPDDVGTIRANLNFLADEPELADLDHGDLVAALRRRFDGAGWEVPRILDGLESTDDLYVDWLRQVRCPTWSRGPVCLLGDAAWCVTPIGGGGASLAITGAYVLAAFLSQHPGEVSRALTEYEEWLRPLVDDAQDLPPGVPRFSAPRSRVGVSALRWATRAAALPPVRRMAERLTSGPASARDLPAVSP